MRKILILSFAGLLFFTGCSSSQRKTISLINNQGLSITNKNDIVLPVLSLIHLEKDEIINKDAKLLMNQMPQEIKNYLDTEKYKINSFSLDHPYLLLNKNYQKPVTVQIAVGDKESVVFWDYEWGEDQHEIVFDLDIYDGDFEGQLGVLINILKTENDIVKEYESYFFVFENKKGD